MRSSLLVFGFVAALGACRGEEETLQGNNAPVADPGHEVNQPADLMVSLDGRGSYDPDGDALTFHWVFDHTPTDSELPGMESPFSNNHDDVGVTAFKPDKVGTYIVQLTVHDGAESSEEGFVVVTATDPEATPVANAGVDLMVEIGSSVELNGTQSYDPLGGALSYSWTLVDIPYNSDLSEAGLVDANKLAPVFNPDVTGTYSAALVVANSMTMSTPDSVSIVVFGDNAAPTADAGSDLIGEDCSAIPLDCTRSSDPEDDVMQYFWELQSKPGASATSNDSFGDRTSGETTFWPDIAGDYQISCSVFDGTTWSMPSIIDVTLSERAANAAPVANAGADRIEDGGTVECTDDGYNVSCDSCDAFKVELGFNGAASDPDDDPIGIAWRVVDGDATLISADQLVTEVILGETAPSSDGACSETEFTFELSVSDCPGDTTSDVVVLKATCCGEVVESEE